MTHDQDPLIKRLAAANPVRQPARVLSSGQVVGARLRPRRLAVVLGVCAVVAVPAFALAGGIGRVSIFSTGTPGAVGAANTICYRRTHELGKARIAGITDLSALARLANRRWWIERRALMELEKLTPPADVESAYHRAFAYDMATFQWTQKLGERAEARDAAGVRAAKEKVGEVEEESLLLRFADARAHSRLKYCG